MGVSPFLDIDRYIADCVLYPQTLSTALAVPVASTNPRRERTGPELIGNRALQALSPCRLL